MKRLSITLMLTVVVSSLGLGLVFDAFYAYYLDRQHTPSIATADTLSLAGKNLSQAIQTIDDSDTRARFIASWSSSGKYQADILSLDELSMPEPLLISLKKNQTLRLASSRDISYHYYLAKTNQILVLKAPIQAQAHKREGASLLLTVLFYLCLLVLVFIWLYPLIGRLRVLRLSALAFGKGQLDKRVDVSAISYIRDIEIEFNQMAQRIEDLLGDVKLLSSAVSHDLRTPLAKIRLGVDVLEECTDEEARSRYISRISRDVDNMTSLVETLLHYARLDQVLIELDKTPIHLNEIVWQAIQMQDAKDVDIEFEQSDVSCQIMGDKKYLSMLCNNVLNNAIRYCQQRVVVKIIQHPDSIELRVTDDGTGIAHDIQQTLFKPFVRGTSQKSGSGYGIGLAVVHRVALWHQAKVSVSNSQTLGGAGFSVVFAKAR